MIETNPLTRAALKTLVWPIRLTRAGLLAERITRGFWPVWTILFTVIAAIAFGLHEVLPVEALWGIGAVVALGLLWTLYRGLRRFSWPTREDALARLDATLSGRPIAALGDALAMGQRDKGSRAVWQAHVARMAERARMARATMPDLRIARADPFGLRLAALTALVMALGFGSLWRIAEVPAMAVGNGASNAAGGPSWEGWAEPPVYTGRPSLYLNSITAGTFELPQGSRIVLRLYGSPDAIAMEETVSGNAPAAVPAAGDAGTAATVQALDFVAATSGQLKIGGPEPREWAITVLPDAAPEVELAGQMRREADGTMSQLFAARDDYAVESGIATFELDLAAVERRHGLAVEPEKRDALVYDLPMPISGRRPEFSDAFVEDASKHPWANLPVRMTFTVHDGQDQAGSTPPESLLLPGRRFFDPVAAAVIELRRDLLWTRDNGPRVAQILRAITHRPEGLLRNERAFLMLRVAMRRLEAANGQGRLSAEMRDEMAEAFWEIAILIEDGGLANALERMRQAQERLSEAIRNGASPEEIQKLMDDLRQATDDYIRQLAENMERQGTDEPSQQADGGQTMSPDMLQQMMDEIQRLMEEGRMAEAQELLDQLNRMMENMRVTEGQPGQGQQGEGRQAMEDLRDTLRGQQGLSDEAFRELQDQFGQENGQQDGQSGEGQPSDRNGQPGNSEGRDGDPRFGEPRDGQGLDGESLAERQRALRDQLRRQQGSLPGSDSENRDAARQALEDAGEAMDGAEEALREGDLPGALERQAEAIENLREGMRSLGEALAQDQRDGAGNQGEALGDNSRDTQRDPLGRSTGQYGTTGTEESLLHGDDVYRRARDLLDEIRRRSGEQTRPPVELDYLKRLLDRF
ncbi:MAG: TIGR02302 family protein [Rhodobacteraceae bacterium]|nr:TIGR02302 family protein [Paracoccaceae bacterium]